MKVRNMNFKCSEVHCGNINFLAFYMPFRHVEHGTPLNEVEINRIWKQLSLANCLFDT